MTKNKNQTIESHRDALAQIRQAVIDEQDAIKATHTATAGPIEAYRNAPSPATRAAAIEAISIRNKNAALMEIFPAESVDLFQRQAVHLYLTQEADSIADSFEVKLSEILAIYPKTRESIASRIAEFGRKALALAGVERAAAFDARDKNEDLLIYIEAQSLRCKNAITYFRNNPSQESFGACEGALGLLSHELNKAAAA